RIRNPILSDYNELEKSLERNPALVAVIWLGLTKISAAFQRFLREYLPKYKQATSDIENYRKWKKGHPNVAPPSDLEQKRNAANAELQTNKDAYDRLRKCINVFKSSLGSFMAKGIFNERLILILAMVQGGAKWGGEFKEGKDEHHFEVRDWQKRWTRPQC